MQALEPLSLLVGAAQGDVVDVVSLGDGGEAVLYFNPPIKNGSGADFAIFENGFQDHYMEFGFVEVSSNGLDFFDFQVFLKSQRTINFLMPAYQIVGMYIILQVNTEKDLEHHSI